MTVVYDAGALVAADRADRVVWSDHLARLQAGVLPVTTAPVVAQASHSDRQVMLRRLLRACEIEPFRPDDAHEVGTVATAAGVPDVVDVHLALVAHRRGFNVLTGDVADVGRVVEALGGEIRVQRV